MQEILKRFSLSKELSELLANEIREGYEPKAIIYLAPPFRHSYYG